MGQCIFITGGVRSGKSAFAEKLVQNLGQPSAYVATSVAFDDEMKDRISRHQQDRDEQSVEWTLYELPYMLSYDVTQPVILFECITTWLTNMLFLQQHANPVQHFKKWVQHLLQEGKTVVIVSNEVLDGGLTAYEQTNTYLQTIGELHVWLVATSTAAYELNNRIVKQWK
ncbi:MAG: bifunctional adenosylcobinamide kinase/adenosylcobinamide-phosphate guanylyltransferase [Lysinibacillus sp.]